MEHLVNLILVLILAGILFHDLRSMTIPLYLLISVLVAAGIRSVLINQSRMAAGMAFINLSGTLLVLLISYIILFLLKKKIFNPFNRLIGTGDLLFLPALCISFSPVNYLVFFIISLLLILVFRLISGTSGRFIPLAGMQSVFLACALLITEFFPFSSYNDLPLLNLIL